MTKTIIADAEFAQAAEKLLNASSTLNGVADRYQKLMDVSGTEIFDTPKIRDSFQSHKAQVGKAMNAMIDAIQPLDRGTHAFLEDIDGIDQVVYGE